MQDALDVIIVSEFQAEAVGTVWAAQHCANRSKVENACVLWYRAAKPHRRARRQLEEHLAELFLLSSDAP